MSWVLHLDMRAPAFGAPAADLYAAALDMAAFADENGASAIVLSEHHGSDDGYLPAALTMAAAVAARTSRAFISVNALPLTLHDPVAVAEQAAVVDLLSGGRLALTVVAGYVPSEFAMFGIDHDARFRIFEDKLGRLVPLLEEVVAPRPRPMVLAGGSGVVAARRAARLADGFSPTHDDPALTAAFDAERERLGRPPGVVFPATWPIWVHVADDVDAAWQAVRPHAEHELTSYRGWAEGDPGSPYAGLADADAARAAGLWSVLTPGEAAALVAGGRTLVAKPLVGGLDPAVGWPSLVSSARAAAG